MGYKDRQKESLADVHLHLAAAKGDFNRLRRILDSGRVYVDCRDKDGTTPLILAASIGSFICCEKLLTEEADPSLRRNTGTTALHFAAQGGYLDVVRLLIKCKAPVNARSKDGGTPLFVASQNGHCDVVRELLISGANVHLATKDKATPLFVAAQNGHGKIVLSLLEAGASPNILRVDGVSPLWMASQMGWDHVVRLLLRAGALVDRALCSDGSTPLYKAAQKGHADVLRELLPYKPNLGLLKNGDSALHAAVLCKRTCVVFQLISAGADINLRNRAGVTPVELSRQNGNLLGQRRESQYASFNIYLPGNTAK